MLFKLLCSYDKAHNTLSLATEREYRLWFTGDLFLDASASIGSFAFPLICLTVTGSPALAGTIALFQGIGLTLGILPGGILADRHNRRQLRLLSSVLGILTQTTLLALLLTGTASVPALSLLALLDRFRSSLFASASNAMIKQVVPEEQLPQAIAINQGREAAVGLGAGPAGGALLSFHLISPVLAQIVGHVLALATTYSMKGKYQPAQENTAPHQESAIKRAFADMKEGATWLWGVQVLPTLVLALCLLNFGISGAIMASTLHLTQQGYSPLNLGTLTAGLSLAMLWGSSVAGRLVQRVPTGRILVIGFCAFTVCLATLPWLPNLVSIGVALSFAWFIVPTVNACLMGFFTLITPDSMIGRAQSIVGLASMGVATFAPALAGWGLSWVGFAFTALFFAGACLLATLTVVISRDVLALPASDQWADYTRERGLLETNES